MTVVKLGDHTNAGIPVPLNCWELPCTSAVTCCLSSLQSRECWGPSGPEALMWVAKEEQQFLLHPGGCSWNSQCFLFLLQDLQWGKWGLVCSNIWGWLRSWERNWMFFKSICNNFNHVKWFLLKPKGWLATSLGWETNVCLKNCCSDSPLKSLSKRCSSLSLTDAICSTVALLFQTGLSELASYKLCWQNTWVSV